jgi:predicted PurR-regulated permease PerM
MFSSQDRIDWLIRLTFGGLILIGCYFVIRPFMTAILLAAILSVVSWPLYQKVYDRVGRRATLASSIMIFVLVVTVLIPLSVTFGILAHQIPEIILWIKDWVHADMPLPQWLLNLPYAGEAIDNFLHFGLDPKALTTFIQKAIDPVTKWVVSVSLGVGNGLFQVALIAFIAFFCYRDGPSLARRVSLFMNRVSGGLAREFNDILINTTRSVVFGVIGTAIGQGLVAAVGFILAGVPGVAVLSFLVCILSVVPVGPPLVWGPAALWLYATGNTGWAIFLVVWGLAAVSSVDNFLKPILIARGTTLPLALVFLGVFGGILSFGFLGLVLGPILLAASIAMFQAWVRRPGLMSRRRSNNKAEVQDDEDAGIERVVADDEGSEKSPRKPLNPQDS